MSATLGGDILFCKATCPLVDEAELQAVITNAKAAHDAWRAVRLLVASAHCTLRAGRGGLVAPLITTAFELCPRPFVVLASLREWDDCTPAQSLITTADTRGNDANMSAVVCTALVVWHGAVALTSTSDCCPWGFLSFSHAVGHIISGILADAASFSKLSVCWLYNTLTFAHRTKYTKAVAFYLLEELYEEAPAPELKEAAERQLVCVAGRNACPRAGLRGEQVVAMWNRLCILLYTEGCTLLQKAQESVCRRSSGMINVLHEVFEGETIHYLPQFKQLPNLLPSHIAQLHDIATSSDLCVCREVFTLIRVACWLKNRVGKEDSAYSTDFPPASISSTLALALRHRHSDIALEILRTGSSASLCNDLHVLWGEELESIIERTLVAARDCERTAERLEQREVTVHRHIRMARPQPLLHENMRGHCIVNMLQTLLLSEAPEELLPVALALIRDDGTAGRRLLEDKIAPSLLLEGLVRLILCLVDEGDLPLARCFLPLVAGICERMPSQTNLVLTLRAIVAFVKTYPRDDDSYSDGQRENIAAAFSFFITSRPFTAAPPYEQTKSTVVGRTFFFRRRVFESLCGCISQTTRADSHCQLQLLFTCNYEAVCLLRSSSCTEGRLQWEKVLPVGKRLLTLAGRMREIEYENQQHLRKTGMPAGGAAPANHGTEKRDEWWGRRRALDRTLKDVVEALQSDEVFGCWRTAMCGDLPPDCQSRLRGCAVGLLRDINAPASHVADVTIMLAGLPFLVASHPVNSTLLFNPSHNGTKEISCTSCDEVLRAASMALEGELLKQGIAEPSSAVVNACCTACRRAFSAMWDVALSQECKSDHIDLLRLPRASLYLVLDNELHCLPFEGIDVLWTNSVARVPTSTFVSSNNMRSESFDKSRVYCAFDPTADMPKTLKRLFPVFQQNGWKVNTQNMSSGELLREIYSFKAQLYVYVGHGKGERLLHREELYERFPDPEMFPAALLMGCGSAQMDSGSSYDCYGMPYAFLHAGCPFFLGCLWHVTDGEIDRVTKRLLLLFAGERVGDGESCLRPPGTVGEALLLARQACRLPFLTGCAVVLYGVDLSLHQRVVE